MTKSTSASSKPSVTTQILQDAPYKPIWARAASNGDTIHLVCSYTDSAAPGEKRSPTRNGIFAPMVYSRSLDGGATWDKQHIMLPDYDSTLTDNGGSDQYAIDVKGSVVAIANADVFQGVILWKSTDFGTTFTRIDAEKFKYAPYKSKTLMNDTPFTNDGTVDVVIDKNNKLHAFWGLARVLDDDTTDEEDEQDDGTDVSDDNNDDNIVPISSIHPKTVLPDVIAVLPHDVGMLKALARGIPSTFNPYLKL
jgi:hypothetical protein